MSHKSGFAPSRITQDFFEISPVRNVKSAPSSSIAKEEDEKAILVLKPFAAKPRMVFKDILIGKLSSQIFTISNPDACDIDVDVSLPNASFQIESSRISIPAKTSVDVKLTWCPTEPGTFSDSIQFRDSKGRRSTISLALSAVSKTAPKRLKTARAPGTKAPNIKLPAKSRPAWTNPVPAKREVLKPVSTQQLQQHVSIEHPNLVYEKEDIKDPLRRETFLVCGKENDGSPALPKTPVLTKMSTDSLDFTPRATSMKKVFSSKVVDFLKEYTLSPLVVNRNQHILANDEFSFTGQNIIDPSLEEMATPSFDARRCSTAFKDLSEKIIKKQNGVSPRELFNQELPFDIPESRMSSATYIAESNDRRASSETYIADRRASNETYVAEKRLSSDTYVLSNSLSFEGTSGDSTAVLLNANNSPTHRPFTPALANVVEESPENQNGQAWQINQTDHEDMEQRKFENSPFEDSLDTGLDKLNDTSFDTPNTAITNSTRKRCALALDSIQFTPFKSQDDEIFPRYNLRSSGKIVKVQEVQTVASITMDISPPKKFKLPSLGSTEKCVTSITEIRNDPEKTFVLRPSASSMYIPFGKKKLVLEKKDNAETMRSHAVDDAENVLLEYAMEKMSAPGLLQDPFYMNPLLTDIIIVKFEKDFKNWLNSVLTPPEELISQDLLKVDAAEMWARSSKSEDGPVLAPSKEMVSSRYLSVKSRLDQLRHAAYTLFNRDEIKSVLCCVNSRVEGGKIKIRSDKALHLDQGLKHGVLGLFMNYNPLWLRIGLETVCGTLIPMRSNIDLQTLSYFLIARILSPEAVVGKSHLLLKAEGRERFNKFVTKKFLMLVFFLDKAKNGRLIRHDPCLFLKNSPIKSSKEMLLSYSRLVLAGEGDITKHLGYMGYKVSHQQGYLHEFNYSVKHLGVDLRDGVRLTQVVELVTGTSGLKAKLRVPAVSRLQKIHNVDVALKGLEANGLTITNLSATDIIMGHREKTLSLIWQIIHNFQTPRFNNAATRIQKWWLQPSLRTFIERRITRKKIVKATITFQKFTRGYLCRKGLANMKAELESQKIRDQSARVIQRAARQFFLRKRAAVLARKYKEDKAARLIQSAFKMFYAQKVLHHLRLEAAIRETALKESSALKLQAYFKQLVAMRKLRVLKANQMKRTQAATCIQNFWRCFIAKQHLKQLKADWKLQTAAATVLQSHWRAKKARTEIKLMRLEILEKMCHAACVIQRAWRCSIARRELLKLQIEQEHRRYVAALTIQCAFRQFLARSELQYRKERQNAAIKVQCAWKCYRARYIVSTKKQEKRCKLASIKIQCAWRCYVARKMLGLLVAENIANRNAAALTIQLAWRSYVSRQTLALLRKEYNQKREAAAVVLQCAWRVRAACRILKNLQMLAKRQTAALKIQCWWRCLLAKKVLQEMLHEAALQRINLAACKIQYAWRVYAAKKLLAELKTKNNELKYQAACSIQTYWRGHLARKHLQKLKTERAMLRNSSAAVIQSAWRCYFARKLLAQLVQEDYARKYRAAQTIQTSWRGLCARRLLQQLKSALAFKKYSAALKIQSAWRRFSAQKKLQYLKQEKHQKQVNAALKIQSWWRIILACRELQKLRQLHNDKVNKAATVIQSSWRGHVTRERLMFEKRTAAATVIQKSWKKHAAQVLLQQLKLKRSMLLNNSATLIQSYWKRYLAHKILLELRFAKQNCAATKIQLCWKSYVARQTLAEKRKRFLQLNTSATVIQCAWRKYQAQKLFAELKNRRLLKRELAATVVQQAWRCHVARVELRNLRQIYYEKRQAAAIKIQCQFRTILAKKQLQQLKEEHQEKRRRAAVKLQSCFRCILAKRLLNDLKQIELENRNEAAVCIQKNVRCYLAKIALCKLKAEAQQEKQNKILFEKQNRAAFAIQKAFRMRLWRNAVGQLNFVKKHAAMDQHNLDTWERALLKEDAYMMNPKLLISITNMQYNLYKGQHIAASIIQQRWRDYLNRKMRAASKLQALWRGYKCRKNIRQAASNKKAMLIVDPLGQQNIQLDKNVIVKLAEKCNQIQEVNKNVKEEETVGYKVLYALNNWQKTFDFEIAAYTLFNRCLGASSTLVMLILPGIPMVVDGFLSNNRSVPAMNLAEEASDILLCVSKYPDALPELLKITKLIPSLVFNMYIAATSNEKVFLNCCAVLWILAHYEPFKKVILAQSDLKYKMTTIKPKVTKKTATKIAVKLPSLKLHESPRSFCNKHHAFEELKKILQLKI